MLPLPEWGNERSYTVLGRLATGCSGVHQSRFGVRTCPVVDDAPKAALARELQHRSRLRPPNPELRSRPRHPSNP
eukprot:3540123-Pyramimonas_sp.AAC.1